MICDLAETYHIYDYKGVSGRLLGTLVAGLGVNSRVYQKLADQIVPTSILVEALIVDELRKIVYLLDGNKKSKIPESMAEKLMIPDESVREELIFDAPEDFEKARKALLGEINGSN